MIGKDLKITAGKRFNPHNIFYEIRVPKPIFNCEELTFREKLCYAVLVDFNGKNNICYVSPRTVAKYLRCTDRHAKRVIASLENKNFIIRVFRDGIRYYHFLWHPCFDDAPIREKKPENKNPRNENFSDNSYEKKNYSAQDIPAQETEKTNDNSDQSSDNDAKTSDPDATQTNLNDTLPQKTPAAVAVSLDEDLKETSKLIIDGVTIGAGILRILRTNIDKHGLNYVKRNIFYSNSHIRCKNKYKAYLDRCMDGNWGEDMSLNPRPKAKADPNYLTRQEAKKAYNEIMLRFAQDQKDQAVIRKKFLNMPEDEQESLKQLFFKNANLIEYKRAKNLDIEAISKNLSFVGFLSKQFSNNESAQKDVSR